MMKISAYVDATASLLPWQQEAVLAAADIRLDRTKCKPAGYTESSNEKKTKLFLIRQCETTVQQASARYIVVYHMLRFVLVFFLRVSG